MASLSPERQVFGFTSTPLQTPTRAKGKLLRGVTNGAIHASFLEEWDEGDTTLVEESSPSPSRDYKIPDHQGIKTMKRKRSIPWEDLSKSEVSQRLRQWQASCAVPTRHVQPDMWAYRNPRPQAAGERGYVQPKVSPLLRYDPRKKSYVPADEATASRFLGKSTAGNVCRPRMWTYRDPAPLVDDSEDQDDTMDEDDKGKNVASLASSSRHSDLPDNTPVLLAPCRLSIDTPKSNYRHDISERSLVAAAPRDTVSCNFAPLASADSASRPDLSDIPVNDTRISGENLDSRMSAIVMKLAYDVFTSDGACEGNALTWQKTGGGALVMAVAGRGPVVLGAVVEA